LAPELRPRRLVGPALLRNPGFHLVRATLSRFHILVLSSSAKADDTVPTAFSVQVARWPGQAHRANLTAPTRLQQSSAVGRDRHYWVYILASRIGGTLYIGVTNDLVRRVYEHREGLVEGFTAQYKVTRLVYYEQFDGAENAIGREKRLKRWNRAWKIKLIEQANPDWLDLYPSIATA
jgi:putative endonuclease